MMFGLFYNVLKSLNAICSPRNLAWFALAIALTALFVLSGFDWAYFIFFQNTIAYKFFFPGAAILGGLLPILVPLALLIIGFATKNRKVINLAWALGQAAILGLLISSFLKVFTGRPGPEIMVGAQLIDISQVFKFGILRGGVFWGWPSSHTTVAFAAALTFITIFPKNKLIKTCALLFAFYVGIGASMSFHWFSDFVAGAILGAIIGRVVGASFSNRYFKIMSNS